MKEQGFTMIELMMVIAIIGILMAFALPRYQEYSNRARFAEVITGVASHKAAVQFCVMTVDDIADCDGGMNGIPKNITEPIGNIGSITVVDGVITATASASLGQEEIPELKLTPDLSNDAFLMWSKEGSSCLEATPALC